MTFAHILAIGGSPESPLTPMLGLDRAQEFAGPSPPSSMSEKAL